MMRGRAGEATMGGIETELAVVSLSLWRVTYQQAMFAVAGYRVRAALFPSKLSHGLMASWEHVKVSTMHTRTHTTSAFPALQNRQRA
jgi:hypothetical protein